MVIVWLRFVHVCTALQFNIATKIGILLVLIQFVFVFVFTSIILQFDDVIVVMQILNEAIISAPGIIH